MSRLLALTHFSTVFLPLRGKRIGYVCMPGNVGDRLIEETTFELMGEFGVDFYVEDFSCGQPEAEELVIAGGGNMGLYWQACRALRVRALETGLPVTVLPQSFIEREDDPYRRVYVREVDSLNLRPDAVLAPDLALGARRREFGPPQEPLGLWLRQDGHGLFRETPSFGDPTQAAETVDEYLMLAARYERIVTDRLHFAIAGLLAARRVTLLPMIYHKTRSMHETWLRHLGCGWAEAP